MNPKNHIILIGLPGVGKTSVGKRLSKLLDINHVDIENHIVTLTYVLRSLNNIENVIVGSTSELWVVEN